MTVSSQVHRVTYHYMVTKINASCIIGYCVYLYMLRRVKKYQLLVSASKLVYNNNNIMHDDYEVATYRTIIV